MRGRVLLAGLGIAFSSAAARPQSPPPGPLPPSFQNPPPAGSAGQASQPGLVEGAKPLTPSDAPLPFPENKIPIDTGRVMTRRENGSWQVLVGPRLFRDLGSVEVDALDLVRTLRAMSVTEWATIGSGTRPVVEYGLVNGHPSVIPGYPKNVIPIDHRTLRVEAIRGVWVVRDDENILFNCGVRRDDAEQAVAVIGKYGFNRVGQIGAPRPALSYLFVSLSPHREPKLGGLGVSAQIANLTHTGVMVPGVGYVGEVVKFDPRKLEVRRDGADWVVAAGPDVFARYGHNEWQARDAVRLIQDARFTEFCSLGGPAGLTFFLVNGKAPNRVPFAALGERFDPAALRVSTVGNRTGVSAGGKVLFDVGGPDDGEALIKLIRHFGFDQLCQFGDGKGALRFLARNR